SDFYILKNGKMLTSPAGLKMMVPTDIEAFMKSELFSEEGKKRALQEKDIPVRQSDEDESFASFITRRFGAEMLENYAAPLFGGIYATPLDELSIQATFPQLCQMEKSAGSITAAMLQYVDNKPGEPDNRSPFVSLKNGVRSLVDALVSKLKQTEIVQKTIEKLYIDKSKNAFVIGFSDGSTLEADQVIMALPVSVAKTLMQNISADAAELLNDFTVSSSKIITLAYNKSDIKTDVNATGFVAVRNGYHRMSASTWSSEKWDFRAPEGILLARCFYDGNAFKNDNVSEEIELAHNELAQIIDIKANNPLHSWTYHWHNALPQYKVGHLDRVKALQQALSAIPNFHIAGAFLSGVGIPDCIRQGKEAAEKLIAT
ncbi:MAG: protoporphyrinogen oxidase, partial [Bacteroidia bacterium]